MTLRSNGLTAPSYRPVADLDPRIAQALLDELGQQGIAAYTSPIESSTVSGFDRPEFLVDVKERLYVDASAADQVSSLLADQDPSLVTGNDDLTWAQIVAGFDQPVATEQARWPADEDVSSDEGADRGNDVTTADYPWPVYDEAPPTSKVRAPDDGEERFVPEPPPPLPRLEPVKQVGWLGVIGGPLLLLLSALFSDQLPSWLVLVGVIGFVGGFVTLVATMRNDDDSDRWSDGGAVV